jgi:catechol 2,3-dioxygenase
MTNNTSNDSGHAPARPFKCHRINEVVLRSDRFEQMITFYVDVLGLQLLRRFEDTVAFMQVGEGTGEDVCTITLFAAGRLSNFQEREFGASSAHTTTLHHFALNIDSVQMIAAEAYLSGLGIQYSTALHTWIGWRSIFMLDPDGNTVELVAYDPEIDRGKEYDFGQLYGDPKGER